MLAFQFGDGLSNILWPTAFMPIICGIAKIRIDKWLRWFVPLFGLLFLTQMGCIALALAIYPLLLWPLTALTAPATIVYTLARWRSPMGDLRFSYGIPFDEDRKGNKSGGRFEFAMGQFF